MKNTLTIIAFLFAINANAQFQENIRINPNQDKNKQYIGISSNGKKILGNRKRPFELHETKGSFKSVLLTDFADALANYIDSLGLITSGGADSINIFNEPVSKDRLSDFNGNSLSIDDADNVNITTSTVNGDITLTAFNDDADINLNAQGYINMVSALGVSLQSDVYAPNLASAITDNANTKLIAFEGATEKFGIVDMAQLPVETITYNIGLNASQELVQEEVTGGGGDSDFYEYMALIRWNTDSMDWVIDSVIINTFPSYFYRSAGGDPALGFPLKCSSCGPTVDFTTFVSGSSNYVEFLSPSTWFYYDEDDSRLMPIFLIYTPATPDIVNVSLIKADGTSVDAGAFDDGSAVDALPVHFKYKIGS